MKTRYKILTAAARSICPPIPAGFPPPPPPPPLPPPPPPTLGGALALPAAGGLGAVGTAGLPGGACTPGFAPTGGGAGLGFEPTGGGGALPPATLTGRELAGVVAREEPFVPDEDEGVFFQGAGNPFEAAMPGKAATGLAEGLAVTEWAVGALGAAGTALGAAGGGGGGGGGAAALGF